MAPNRRSPRRHRGSQIGRAHYMKLQKFRTAALLARSSYRRSEFASGLSLPEPTRQLLKQREPFIS